MQLTPLSCLHANREYILLKLINNEWVDFPHINLYVEYSFRNIQDMSDIIHMSYQNIVYQNWLQ